MSNIVSGMKKHGVKKLAFVGVGKSVLHPRILQTIYIRCLGCRQSDTWQVESLYFKTCHRRPSKASGDFGEGEGLHRLGCADAAVIVEKQLCQPFVPGLTLV